MAKHKSVTRRVAETLIQSSRRVSPAEKAAFHAISGAGKSRVLREFFGLSTTDEDAIVTLLEQGLDAELAKGNR